MGNALILGVIELLGETFALGDAVGIDSAAFLQFIDLFFPTPSYMAYGRKIAEGSFGSAGGFRLEGGLKGTHRAKERELAKADAMPLPPRLR